MGIFRTLATAGGLALVAGLANSAGPFDGSYVGSVTNERQATTCGPMQPWHGTFWVVDNRFRTNIGHIVVEGDVRPDGSFSTVADMGMGGRSAVLHFSGKIDGNNVHALGTSPLCRWGMEMQK